MKHRLVSVLGAVALAGAIALGVSGTAFAMTPAPTASQIDCDNAAGLTATAMTNYNNQLTTVTARLKELGFTSTTISSAEQLLNSGPLTTEMKVQLLQMVYAEHIQGQVTAADGTSLATLLDLKVKVDAAVAVQNLACLGLTPTVVVPAPAATSGAIVAPTTVAPAPVYTSPVPTVAPSTGGGGAFNGGN